MQVGLAKGGAMDPTRKLYRSKTNRKLAGVCGGLAQYFNVDATHPWDGVAPICFRGHGWLASLRAAVLHDRVKFGWSCYAARAEWMRSSMACW
jgi:phage shock protein C